MGSNDFAPFPKFNTSFVVRNIAVPKKVIRIFHYPINQGEDRDLLAIPGVSEGDIRASLLKGEVNHKLRVGDITIINSDIDLLQFNTDQRNFLQSHGVVIGTTVGSTNIELSHREDQVLNGAKNGINVVFTIPNGEKFIQSSTFGVMVFLNGLKQLLAIDFIVSESGGPGTGYDTVIFSTPPGPNDVVSAYYYVAN